MLCSQKLTMLAEILTTVASEFFSCCLDVGSVTKLDSTPNHSAVRNQGIWFLTGRLELRGVCSAADKVENDCPKASSYTLV